MDIVEIHEQAVGRLGHIVDGVTPDQYEQPTPCSEWDVKALLDHIVGTNWMFAGLAEGTSPEAGNGSSSNGDHAAAFHKSAEALIRAWARPGVLDQTYTLPFGEIPGQALLGIHVVEAVQHGWDLARATGQAAEYDPALVEAATQTAHAVFPDPREPGHPIAPAVSVPDDLPAVDRLAAYLGRQV